VVSFCYRRYGDTGGCSACGSYGQRLLRRESPRIFSATCAVIDLLSAICAASRGWTILRALTRMPFCYYPCPCGYYGDPVKECTCSPAMMTRYQKRISGPLLDRIDTPSASRCRGWSMRSCLTTAGGAFGSEPRAGGGGAGLPSIAVTPAGRDEPDLQRRYGAGGGTRFLPG
jgi:Magnesium chelatase, subunit ChlI